MGFAPVLGTPKAQRIAQVALGDVDLLDLQTAGFQPRRAFSTE